MNEIIVALIGLAGIALSVWLSNRSISVKLDKMSKNSDEHYLAILRLTVMNSEMPIPERIAAGQEYIRRGGNGGVKQYYHDFLEEHIA